MNDRWRFMLNRIRERLWVRPLLVSVVTITAVLLASLVDSTRAGEFLPDVSVDSIEALLQIMSASMLVIATFAVGSMVAAYSAASGTATPRSFPLVIADDVSQNALSTFVGAFIFSIVALVAIKNGYFENAGRFLLFALTLTGFAIVIVTFVKWVDNIARLGRLGSTIEKVEASARASLQRRREHPILGGVATRDQLAGDEAMFSDRVGYVQRVDIAALQAIAEGAGIRIRLSALPGTFAAPGRPLAFVIADGARLSDLDIAPLREAFLIGSKRTFDEDPRFGLIVLSEIACRALSPAVNDPGTAIDVIGSFVRLFSEWSEPVGESGREMDEPVYPLIEVPELSLEDMFDDAFRAIARDGAGTIEVAVRLQKAFGALSTVEGRNMRDVAVRHARLAIGRAEAALEAPEDLALLRTANQFNDIGV